MFSGVAGIFKSVSYFLSDVAFWLRSHPFRALGGLLAVAALAAGAYFAATELGGDKAEIEGAPAPQVFVEKGEAPSEPAQLGFPAFATRNTTRVAGADSVGSAAGVALATFPSGGAVDGPSAVTLVDSENWAAAIAASQLIAEPIGAPILYTRDGAVDDLTQSAIDSLSPQGERITDGAQVIKVGDAATAEGLNTIELDGKTPAELAEEVLALRADLAPGPIEHVLIASSDDPEFAMPAAAWAARSGDPVLFAQADSVPSVTIDAIKQIPDVPIYILGPDSVISDAAAKELDEANKGDVIRIPAEEDPISNAIAFARFFDGNFGWNINDPGHGFVIANTSRPSDAGAAAALSGTGKWGPLLLTDDAEQTPAALEGYLLDLKPGYENDPTRAVYNHIWVIGDAAALSVEAQVELDEIAEVARIESGTGDELLGVPSEPETPDDRDDAGDQGPQPNRNPDDDDPQ